MDPDSRWILREMVSRPGDGEALHDDSVSIPDVSRARLQRVRALLTRHGDGERVYTAICELDEAQCRFIIHWVDVIARSDSELARVFATHAVQALSLMDMAGVEAWLIRAMDAYDKRGLGYAISVIEDLETFAGEYAERHIQVSLDSELGVLQPLIIGLGGRPLTIAADESGKAASAYTDTESIYLPANIRYFRNQQLNRRLLTAQTVYQWAQNRYGTWQLKPLEQLSRLPDPTTSIQLYAQLECYRIEACLARDLPGLARSLQALNSAQAG
ncbi:MAG: hypothetical protein U5P41_15960 [Gammaproteobacteria bacterium]|nr:hypothetical protein [Gammaproteobacteria bacterium]